MTEGKAVKNVLKLIAEMRNDSEMHRRQPGFQRRLDELTAEEELGKCQIFTLKEKNARIGELLIFTHEDDPDLRTALQKSAIYAENRIRTKETLLPEIAEKIATQEHLVEMYKVRADRKLMEVYHLEEAIGVTKLNYPNWKLQLDMEHYKETGIMINRK